MVPVPHIAARSLTGRAELDEYVAALVDAHVTEVLVVAGGVSDQDTLGGLRSSMDVLESGVLQKYGIRSVGFAAHPQGSKDISNLMLSDALKLKNEWARDHKSVACYLETQFCFDAEPLLLWERRIRDDGNVLPIRIGVAGPATLKTLFTFANLAGVQVSARVLASDAAKFARLATTNAPDALLCGVAAGISTDESSLIGAVHFYSFGGVRKTAEYAGSVASGRFLLDNAQTTFTVK